MPEEKPDYRTNAHLREKISRNSSISPLNRGNFQIVMAGRSLRILQVQLQLEDHLFSATYTYSVVIDFGINFQRSIFDDFANLFA